MSQASRRGTLAARQTGMRLPIAFVLVAATACTQQETIVEETPEQIELQGARTRFDTTMPSSYTFHWRRSCECTQEAAAEMLVTVSNGVITNAIYVATELPVPANIRDTLSTIDGVFDTIQDAIDQNAHTITVHYDADRGFPTSVAIDYSVQIADEELSLTISDVQPIAESCGVRPCG